MKLPAFSTILLFLAVTPAVAATGQNYSGGDHAVASLLLSTSDQDVRLGATILYGPNSNRPELFDVAAEVAWMLCSGKQSMDPDTLSWLAKALGNTKQTRFAPLLDSCLANPANDKSKKHVSAARAQLAGDVSNAFEGGKLDLEKLREQLTKKDVAIPKDQLTSRFNDLGKGRTIDEMYAALGKPDN